MNTRTTIIAGLCIASLSLASVIARAAEPYYQVKLENTLVSGYQSGDAASGRDTGIAGGQSDMTAGQQRSAVKLPDAKVTGYQTGGTPAEPSAGTAIASVTDLVIDPFNSHAGMQEKGLANVGKTPLNSLNSLGSMNDLFANSRGAAQAGRHTGGVNVALADGSVRFSSDKPDTASGNGRSVSSNNLHQLGVALHNSHDAARTPTVKTPQTLTPTPAFVNVPSAKPDVGDLNNVRNTFGSGDSAAAKGGGLAVKGVKLNVR